jgi:sporulation protein YlmC with PRC-barrel domain
MFLSLGGNMALAEKAFKGEENQVKEVKQQEAVLSAFKEKFLQASKMIGIDLRNTEGVDLGTVTDLLIDEDHHIRFVVFSTGGLLGLGDTEYLVPFEPYTRLLKETDGFVQVNEEELKKTPEFGDNIDPEEYGVRLYDYYGLKPYWEKKTPDK